ncbi:MAG TPA: hypothetical protein VGK29_18935 [Paludibaculum sp.]|jgi:nitrate reductase NapAB chaperone NapD
MPIKSYLAYPVPGHAETVTQALAAFDGCDVFPALNQDVLILVTDTQDEPSESWLEEQLALVPDLQCLALVSGLNPDLVQINPTLEHSC